MLCMSWAGPMGRGACTRLRGGGGSSLKHPGHRAGAHATCVNHEVHATRNQQGTRPAHTRPTEWGSVRGGRPGQRVEEQGTWASCTRQRSEAGHGRPEDGGVGTAKKVKRPPQQPAQPQYANHWAPLTRKRHIPPHPAQPRHTNHWAPRTRQRHEQEHRPQRPTERSDPTQHAKGRTGDCPGPHKETTTRRNVTLGGGSCVALGTWGVGPGAGMGWTSNEQPLPGPSPEVPPAGAPAVHPDSTQGLPERACRARRTGVPPVALRCEPPPPLGTVQAVSVWQWLPLVPHPHQPSLGPGPLAECTIPTPMRCTYPNCAGAVAVEVMIVPPPDLVPCALCPPPPPDHTARTPTRTGRGNGRVEGCDLPP